MSFHLCDKLCFLVKGELRAPCHGIDGSLNEYVLMLLIKLGHELFAQQIRLNVNDMIGEHRILLNFPEPAVKFEDTGFSWASTTPVCNELKISGDGIGVG